MKMKKKHKWSFASIIGLSLLIIFAIICIAPFIYMLIMSFTQSTTLMITWKDINLSLIHI